MTDSTSLSFEAGLEQQNAALRRRLADQAMAGELLLGVLAAGTETAAIAGLIDLTEQLCSPAVSAYLPAHADAAPILHPSSPDLLAAVTELAELLPAERSWIATDDGFAVRVDAGGQRLGTLVVASVRFPEYVADYVNLMLTTAGVVGMAILLGRERQNSPAGATPPELVPTPRSGASDAPSEGTMTGGLMTGDPYLVALISALPHGVVLQDVAGQVVECNPAAERILGLSREQLAAGNSGVWARGGFLHPDGRPVTAAEHPASVAQRTASPAPEALFTFLGGNRATARPGAASARQSWIWVTAAPAKVAGEVVGTVTTLADVTKRHREHQALRGRLRNLGDTLDVIPAAVVVLLPQRNAAGEVSGFDCVAVNPAAVAWFGMPACHHDDSEAAMTVLNSNGLTAIVEQVAQTGAAQWLDHAPSAPPSSGRLWVGPAGDCVVVLGEPRNSPRPVSDPESQGLSMQTRAQVAATMAAQLGPDATNPTLMLLDIDDFRSVNDAMGHEFGDRYLVGVAEAIAALLPAGDRVTRVGGDEFAITVGAGADPQALAERIRDRLAAGIQVADQLVTAAASIGVATGSQATSAHTLVAQADTAMAQAKHAGGNQWHVAASASSRDNHVIKMEHELREALIADQLLLRYQPVFDLEAGRLAATEALVRWQHPDRGLVMPAEFIPVAERRHLIVPVGEWVLRRACRQAAAWRQEMGGAAPAMAVNVSSLELGGHGLPRRLGALLAEYGLPAAALYLEITETQLITATDQVSEELAAVRALGVGVAIDDFGTGHAGFDYLRTIPANILKVDKSFIDGLGRDATDTAIAASIIALGRSLGMTVIAEGVEEEQQLAVLRDLGCHQGQGWLWRPALQASDAAALVGLHEAHARA